MKVHPSNTFGDRSNQRVLVLVALLMILVTLGLREIANRPTTYADYPSNESRESTTVVILSGATGEEIARQLEELDVIASWQLFFQLALTDERALRIAPGSYLLQKRIPVRTALDQLLDPDRIRGSIVLRDGVRLSEVRQLLVDLGYTDVDRALRSISPPTVFDLQSLEGFLYPARYSFEPGTTTEQVISAILERFEIALAGLDIDGSGLSPKEMIIMASLIEAEGTPDVFAKVSRVILNRLERGMPLQLDSTVHYIQGSRGEISLSLAETMVKSPYNTYQNRGLPPGPIGSPTRAAMVAALDPEPGDWIYFITVAPGDTRFTSSYEEFLAWKRLYRANYAEGLFDD